MLSSEVVTLESLHHPNVLRLFEVIEMWNRVYIITEFIAGGELYNKISLEGPVREPHAAVLFKQLLDAVQYMHTNAFVHRDIKAENVLLVSETRVKLADFGFSAQLKEPLEKLDTFCGSPPYAAPELFTENHYIGQYVDIWALGVLLYFMVVGNMPFRAPTVPALRSAVLKGHYLLPSTLSLPCNRVIQRILVQSPIHRPTLEHLADSQWMRHNCGGCGVGAGGWGAEMSVDEAVRVKQNRKDQNKFSRLWSRTASLRSRGRSSRKTTTNRNKVNNSNSRRGGSGAEEVMPIACSTKRSDSVLEANYLFPIEAGDGDEDGAAKKKDSVAGGGGGEEKRAAKPRRSLFSLGLASKTKIGPMDSVVIKGGGGGGQTLTHQSHHQQQMNNNNNNNNSSCAIGDQQPLSIVMNGSTVGECTGDERMTSKRAPLLLLDRRQEKYSGHGGDLKGIKEGGDDEVSNNNFEMVPTFAIDSESSSPVHQLETEALRIMSGWGISQGMLSLAVPSGARNELMGIYRIVVHRLQLQEERQVEKAVAAATTALSLSQFTKDEEKRRALGQGCGGRCPRKSSNSNCVIL